MAKAHACDGMGATGHAPGLIAAPRSATELPARWLGRAAQPAAPARGMGDGRSRGGLTRSENVGKSTQPVSPNRKAYYDGRSRAEEGASRGRGR